MAAEDWYDPCETFDDLCKKLIGRQFRVRVKPRKEEIEMGEEADYQIERMIFGPMDKYDVPERTVTARGNNFQRGIGNFKWRRADGTVIDMEDMDDEYLANCISVCERSGNTGKKEQLEFILRRRQKQYLDNARTATKDLKPEEIDNLTLRIGASNSVPMLKEER